MDGTVLFTVSATLVEVTVHEPAPVTMQSYPDAAATVLALVRLIN